MNVEHAFGVQNQVIDDDWNETETLRQRHLMSWRSAFNSETVGNRRLTGIARDACVAVMLLLAPPDKDAPAENDDPRVSTP